MEAACLANLGRLFAERSALAEAVQVYEQQLAIASQIEDRYLQATALFNLSRVLYDLSETTRALALAGSALALFEQIDDPNAALVRRQMAAWQEGA